MNKEKLKAVAERLGNNAGRIGETKAFIGLDGFVDEIIHVVDKRYDTENFDRIEKIADFGEKIKQAGGLSCNFELVPASIRLGGNGPIYANALLSFGTSVTYCGALGYPEIHQVFRGMADNPRCEIISKWEPSHTDALEFSDGKIFLGKIAELSKITWESFKNAMGGAEGVAEAIEKHSLFGMENWTMIPHMSDIWEGIVNEVFPLLSENKGEKPFAFFDTADPAKRTKSDITRALGLISRFTEEFRVILGLNEKEAREIAFALDINLENLSGDGGIQKIAEAIFAKLDIYCLVVHPTKWACAVTKEGYFSAAGSYCEKPAITTGAGDNFNAGFCLGQLLGLDTESSLITGVFASGYYVRNAKSADLTELAGFIEDTIR